jgi:hypothetical protein
MMVLAIVSRAGEYATEHPYQRSTASDQCTDLKSIYKSLFSTNLNPSFEP